MTEVNVRTAAIALAAGLVTVAGALAAGGWAVPAGLVAGLLAARSVFRGDEGDVTTAVVVGGLTILIALSAGHVASIVVAAGVFAGAELAAMGRWVHLDPDAPLRPDLTMAGASIAAGLAAGAAAVAVASTLRAAPPLANAALVALVVVATAVALGARRQVTGRRAAPDAARSTRRAAGPHTRT